MSDNPMEIAQDPTIDRLMDEIARHVGAEQGAPGWDVHLYVVTPTGLFHCSIGCGCHGCRNCIAEFAAELRDGTAEQYRVPPPRAH